MSAKVIASLLNALIPLIAGIFFTLYGFRIIGTKPGEDAGTDEYFAKYGWICKVLGPLLCLFADFLAMKDILLVP